MTLNEAKVNIPVSELYRKQDISNNTIYTWKTQYSGLTAREASRLIENWRFDYNRERPDSSLGNLSPEEFIKQQLNNLLQRALLW